MTLINEDNESHLISAASLNETEVVKVLISHGADLNETNACCRKNPLHFVSSFRNFDLIKFLLEKGADPNVRDAENRSTLEIVLKDCRIPNVGIIEVLLEYGANDNLDSCFALSYDSGNVLHMRYFLKKGASVECPSNDNKTLLHTAIKNITFLS